MSDSVLILGAGLSGLAAAEVLLDAGLDVTVIDSFPLPGGRVASFDVPGNIAGLVAGDVVEHGLHGFFQHYRALYGLMERAGLEKPPFAGQGVHYWNPERGHFAIEGGPLVWLLNALRLPNGLRGSRVAALAAFGRLIGHLDGALADPERTDRESAYALLARFHVPSEAVDGIFRPCMYSLTSLPLEELSALELFRWLSRILPDPRIRALQGGGTAALCAPITRYLIDRGADVRFGVEVHRLTLQSGRAELSLTEAPDRTGVRHVLVPGFSPAPPPDPAAFDAVLCTLPCDRLRALASGDVATEKHWIWQNIARLENVHPLTIRMWFERPIEGAVERYILCSGTVFDVLKPTPEPHRYPGIRMIDALVENIASHLPELAYRGERFLDANDESDRVAARVRGDLEQLYPGQIDDNIVLRRFLHTREGIIAARPGVWSLRPPQYVGSSSFVLAGDWTKQPFGVCMEGAVCSGQLAARSLLAGRQVPASDATFGEVRRSAGELLTQLTASPLRRRSAAS